MDTMRMTADQTYTYDTDEQGWREGLRNELFEDAQRKADSSGETVELVTDDGIVVEVFYPQ